MKLLQFKLILLLIISFTIFIYPQNWAWKQPEAGSNNLYAIAPASENIWVAAGEKGTLFRTSDYGNTWSQIFNSIGSSTINLITFASSSVGYAVSKTDFNNDSAYVIKTTDAGLTWNKVTAFYWFNGIRIQFFDEQNGYIATSYNLKRTTNGGLTWFDQPHPISGFSFDIYFPSTAIGYGVGENIVFKTTDGGNNWAVIDTLPDLIFIVNIHFINNTVGYAVSSVNNSKLYKTTNGGLDWFEVFNSNYPIYRVHSSPTDSNYVTVVGESILYESTNAGNTWITFFPSPNGSFDYRFNSVRYFNNNKAIGVTDYGNIYGKTDNGWQLFQDWKREHINSLYFINNSEGFAVDSKGGINYTYDEGENWSRFQVPYFENNMLQKIYFSSSQRGVIFGISDTILTTINGGLTWVKSHIPNYNFVWDVHFPTRDVGYAVGQNGTVYKSTDGGINWSALSTNISFHIHTVFFLNMNIGFIGSNWTGLWKTTDGGINWTLVNDQVGISSISFANALVGYATAGGPSILKTTNGGTTWTTLSFPNVNVNKIVFTTENIGYAVCLGGLIYKTTDGGLSWTDDNAGVGTSDQSLNDVFLKQNGYLYAVGNRGSFLQSRFPETQLPGVTLRIMDTVGVSEDTVIVNVKLENPARRFIYGTKQAITNFSPLVNFIDLNVNNSLIGNYNWNYNSQLSNDTIHLSALGNVVSSSEEIFYRLKFYAPSNSVGTRTLQFVTPEINDGRISVTALNGTLTINSVNPVTIQIVDTSGIAGDTVVITVKLKNPFNRILTSTDIVITNYNALLEYLSIDTVGTLLGRSNWNINASATEDAFYLTGSGTQLAMNDSIFFKIKFLARQNASGQTSVQFFNAQFNNNTIPVIRQDGTLIIRPRLQTIWQYSASSGNIPSWFGIDTERGLAFGRTLSGTESINDRIFVVSRSSGLSVIILNAQTGNEVGTLNTSGISGGTFSLNDIGVTEDGKILACNLTMNANIDAFRVYMWNNETSAPVLLLSYLADASNNITLGDKFTVTGNYLTGTAQIWAASSTTGQNKVFRWSMSGGVFNNTPQIIELSDVIVGSIANASVSPLMNNSFYWNANGQNARKYSSDGTLIGVIPSSVISTATNAIRYMGNLGSDEFVAAYSYENNNIVVARILSGIPENAISYSNSPTLGSLTNANGTGDIDSKTNSDFTIEIFILATNNGIGLFTTSAFIPVELISFKGDYLNGKVQLIWETASELNNVGFDIERNSKDGFEKIGFVRGNGTTTEKATFSFMDENPGYGKIQYRLKQIDFDGAFSYSNEIDVDIATLKEFALYQNYPNPFNPVTTIKFHIPNQNSASQDVSLKIYDILGNELATLVNEIKEPGIYEIKWDATRFASGIYFYTLRAGEFISTKKLTVIK